MRFIYSKNAQKQFKKLDIATQKRIKNYTQELQTLDNPRARGKSLAGDLSGFWRYRVGDYRIICEIIDSELVIYAICIAHRSKAYKG
ncbi:type II toxin-antitoxin system RelE family toxin [Helicobacter sp. 23-1044]